jgi:hypothetical protein
MYSIKFRARRQFLIVYNKCRCAAHALPVVGARPASCENALAVQDPVESACARPSVDEAAPINKENSRRNNEGERQHALKLKVEEALTAAAGLGSTNER